MYDRLFGESLSQLLATYKYCNFNRDVRIYILGLPRRKLATVSKVLNGYLLCEEIPNSIVVLVRDLIRFRNPLNNKKD